MFMMHVGGCLDPSFFMSSIMKSRLVLMSDLRVMSIPAPNWLYAVTLRCSFSLTMGAGRITCHPRKDVVIIPFHHSSWISRTMKGCSDIAMFWASACIVLVEWLMLILHML